jgi:serine-type D-Ala-D-Ala carboxypeptidase (penicillin-binding protein 5/6)
VRATRPFVRRAAGAAAAGAGRSLVRRAAGGAAAESARPLVRSAAGAAAMRAARPRVRRSARALAAALLLAPAGLAGPAPAPAATPAAAPPAIRAPSAILVEPATGDVVFQRRAGERRAIASTTKLMTALVALERARLSRTLRAVRYRGAPAESVAGLRARERLTVADLLRATLVASANDAAATLAARLAPSRRAFVALMNRRARSLGLRDTHFANPIGLDQPGNYSSAADLVKLALILRRNAFFRGVTDRPRVTLRSGTRARTLVNRNTLVRTVGFVNGVKTGHTAQAGYVLVGSGTRDGVTVVSAVLGDPGESQRDADTLALLRYGLRRYHRSTPVRRGQRFGAAGLRHRDERVDLLAARTVTRTVPRGEPARTRVVGAPAEIDGPLPAGARVATIEVRWRGRTVGRVPLVTAAAVGEASFAQRLGDVISRTAVVLLMAAISLASLQVLLRRRRSARARDTGIA